MKYKVSFSIFVMLIALLSMVMFSKGEKVGLRHQNDLIFQSDSSAEMYKIEFSIKDEDKDKRCFYDGFILAKKDSNFSFSKSESDSSLSIEGKLNKIDNEKFQLEIDIRIKCPGDKGESKFYCSGLFVTIGETINIPFGGEGKKVGTIKVNLY